MSRLELIEISKEYPGTKANDRISLRVEAGEIHAVLGENGAGKSTLMKIIYGSVTPDSGQRLWDGQYVEIPSPQVARQLGISMVFQHFSLFETLSVAENVWLGLDDHWSLEEVSRRVEALADAYGLELEPRRPVHTLSVGEKQRVEIVRALMSDPKLLILDEPTSVLTPPAVQRLFGVLRKLAAQGCSILYISHKLDEVRELCHRCTVLRSGRVTGEVRPAEHDNASLSRLMIGSEPPRLPERKQKPGSPVLEVKGLSLRNSHEFSVALRDVDLCVHAGEIVGIAGVSGSGQKELLAAISGEDLRAPKGSVKVSSKDVSRATPDERRRMGLRFIPEERLGRAVVPQHSLAENTLLTRTDVVGPFGGLTRSRLAELARKVIARFDVKANGASAAAKSLSGGNLQKYIVGREIDAEPKLLVVSQPTWGVDVAAAARIRGELLALRDRGVALLIVSEELDELFELSDTLLVMAGGRLSPPMASTAASIDQVGSWMSGLFPSREMPPASGAEAHV